MQQQNFDMNQLNKLQQPLKKIIELNKETFKSFSYINPLELSQTRKPEDLIEKSMRVFVANSHKTIDYMYDLFNILEDHWLHLSDEMQSKTEETMRQAQSSAQKAMKTTLRTAEKMSPSKKKVKKTAKTKTKMGSHVKMAASKSTKPKTKTRVSTTKPHLKTAHSNVKIMHK